MPPIVFFATLLPALVHGPLTFAANVIRTVSGALYTTVYEIKLWARNATVSATDLIFSAQDLPLIGSPQFWVDFITLIAQGVEWAFSAITTIPNLIIRWMDGYRTIGVSEEGDISTDFSWIVQIEMVRDALVEFATTVGQKLDEVATGVVGGLDAIATWVFDPIGRTLGDLYGLLEGTGYNPWDWIKANTPNIFDAVNSLKDALWNVFLDWLLAKLTDLLGWLLEIATPVLDWLGNIGGWLYGVITATGYNPWLWIRANTPNALVAWDSLIQALWGALQDWVIAGWNDLRGYIDDFLGLPATTMAIWDWLVSTWAWWQAFKENPWEVLFMTALNSLWPAVERWLTTVWDGTDRATP